MKTKKYRSWANYTIEPKQKFDEPSLTVPGMALSINMQVRKALESGQMMVRPVHFTNSEYPLPDMKDLTDIDNVLEYNRKMTAKMIEWEKQAMEEKHKKDAEIYQAEIDKRFQEYLKINGLVQNEPKPE